MTDTMINPGDTVVMELMFNSGAVKTVKIPTVAAGDSISLEELSTQMNGFFKKGLVNVEISFNGVAIFIPDTANLTMVSYRKDPSME